MWIKKHPKRTQSNDKVAILTELWKEYFKEERKIYVRSSIKIFLRGLAVPHHPTSITQQQKATTKANTTLETLTTPTHTTTTLTAATSTDQPIQTQTGCTIAMATMNGSKII